MGYGCAKQQDKRDAAKHGELARSWHALILLDRRHIFAARFQAANGPREAQSQYNRGAAPQSGARGYFPRRWFVSVMDHLISNGQSIWRERPTGLLSYR